MNALTIAIKYGPTIAQAIKIVADQLPDSDGKTRLQAAIAFVQRLEDLADDVVPALTKAVNSLYAVLKTGAQVKAPAAKPAA